MKNRWFVSFILAVLLFSAALPATTAFAANKTAILVEFKHQPLKGWVVVFKISGEWKPADLKGNTITVGGQTYNLYCNFRDSDHVSCTMSHYLGQNIGRSASIFFDGQSFVGQVPVKRVCNTWYLTARRSNDYYGYGGGVNFDESWNGNWEYNETWAYGSNDWSGLGFEEPWTWTYENSIPPDASYTYYYDYQYIQLQYERACSGVEFTGDGITFVSQSFSTNQTDELCQGGVCSEYSYTCDNNGCTECKDGVCEHFPNP